MIYVICPAFHKTGGTELLHQLVCALNDTGKQLRAQIAYTDCENYPGKFVNPAFIKYVGNNYIRIDEVEDNPGNTLVCPEISCFILKQYNQCKKIIWWLSVDNYIRECGILGRIKISGIIHGIGGTIIRLLKGKYRNIKNDIYNCDLHLCQSYYAKLYLKAKGIPENKIADLSDYINQDYLDKADNDIIKKDIILYNPKKGASITKRLINAEKSFTWVPLVNLTNEEMRQVLQTAKVYIDFGYHPGKDRIPREAAICGCCVITGRRGAAGNNIDIPISDRYKFDDKRLDTKAVINEIQRIFDNYDLTSKDFDEYRSIIRKERNKFYSDVIKIFGQ